MVSGARHAVIDLGNVLFSISSERLSQRVSIHMSWINLFTYSFSPRLYSPTCLWHNIIQISTLSKHSENIILIDFNSIMLMREGKNE